MEQWSETDVEQSPCSACECFGLVFLGGGLFFFGDKVTLRTRRHVSRN